ncbi:hypothetical protein L6164_023689 [Bauhinia variegata]|uniref:Uncharacterized protein n=1 Tax=Bauhinia variegata TaxID=167791 RepID=A0ACB9MJF0_BAUVA|nr:hypothetical protein L6164_023689 [Bauhinia variegata]
MKLRRLSMFIFLVLAPVVVGAALPAELYWKSMLPNTAMPKAVKDLLRAENMKKVISVNQNVPLVLQRHDTPMTDQLLGDPKSTLLRRELPTSAADQLHNDPNLFFYEWAHPTSSATDPLHNDPNIFFYGWGHPPSSATDQLHNDPNLFFYEWAHPTSSATDQLHNDPNLFFYDWAHPTTSAATQQPRATLGIDQPRDDSLKGL